MKASSDLIRATAAPEVKLCRDRFGTDRRSIRVSRNTQGATRNGGDGNRVAEHVKELHTISRLASGDLMALDHYPDISRPHPFLRHVLHEDDFRIQ
jgi:hypothetical protein